MSETMVVLDLAGYVGLLLWGTHMVSSGVQRGFGSELQRWLANPHALAGLTDHGSATPEVVLIGVLVVVGGLGAGALTLAARRRLG